MMVAPFAAPLLGPRNRPHDARGGSPQRQLLAIVVAVPETGCGTPAVPAAGQPLGIVVHDRPSPYVRLDRFITSPTVTLSVYFRTRLPRPNAENEDICLARFETRLVRDGGFHSDGMIRAPDGTVLAETHQLQPLLAN